MGVVAKTSPTEHDESPSISLLALMAALLLSGLVCGVAFEFAYESLLLFAALEGLGIPITVCACAILTVKAEQEIVFLITKWRPGIGRLILAAVPAAALSVGLHFWLHASWWMDRTLLLAAALMIQAVILRSIACTPSSAAREAGSR